MPLHTVVYPSPYEHKYHPTGNFHIPVALGQATATKISQDFTTIAGKSEPDRPHRHKAFAFTMIPDRNPSENVPAKLGIIDKPLLPSAK